MNTGACTCMHPYTHSTHRATHLCACIDTCVCSHKYSHYTFMHSCACMNTHSGTHTFSQCTVLEIHTHTLMHTHEHTFMHTCSLALRCSHTCTHVRLLHRLQCSHFHTASSHLRVCTCRYSHGLCTNGLTLTQQAGHLEGI